MWDIAAAVRCAPPDNKPTPEEIHACQPHLEAELAQLPNIRVVVALGKIAFDVWWKVRASKGVVMKPRPSFGHGAICRAAERSNRDRLVSSEQAEHEHGKVDAADDVGRIQKGCEASPDLIPNP